MARDFSLDRTRNIGIMAHTGCPEAGTAAHALHLRPMQSAHQESQAEGRFYHAGGRVCSHP